MKKFIALLLAMAMVLALAACGSTAASSAAAEETASSAAEAAASAEAPASTDGLKYAVILKTQATSFWTTMYNGVQEYAAANGISVDLYNATSDTDDAGQLAIVEQCINSGDYAGIAIAPVNGNTLVAAVKQANDAGIPVVNIDEQFNEDEMNSQGATCVGFVSSDNVSIGHLGAEYLCTLIEAGSEVGVIEGIAGNTSSEDRASGAKAAFEEAGMNIVADKACDWDMQTALDTVAAWVTQYPDLKAIYCCNDGMAAGVRAAVAAAGADILVCGTDGDTDAIEAVAGTAADGISMTATVAQDPAQIGITSLEVLMDAVANPDKYPASAAPEKTPVDAILVTADNAADYLG